MPYRLPPERPSEGPSDEELAGIARACGIEPQWYVPVQTPAAPLSAADELRQAQERSKRSVVPLSLMIALTVLAALAGIAVIVFALILALVVPGIVSGVTK